MSKIRHKLVVMISGNGSNLQALLDSDAYCGDIVLVVSNNVNAYGLVRARKQGIETFVPDKHNYDELLNKKLDEVQPDGIILAGYLKIVPQQMVKQYQNKIINIHPSLIPSFCGKGYYGPKVAQAALDYGVRYTGVTTHFVSEQADEGPIIFQEIVAINSEDTVTSLTNRVLEIEHALIVKTVVYFCNHCLKVDGRHVLIGGQHEA